MIHWWCFWLCKAGHILLKQVSNGKQGNRMPFEVHIWKVFVGFLPKGHRAWSSDSSEKERCALMCQGLWFITLGLSGVTIKTKMACSSFFCFFCFFVSCAAATDTCFLRFCWKVCKALVLLSGQFSTFAGRWSVLQSCFACWPPCWKVVCRLPCCGPLLLGTPNHFKFHDPTCTGPSGSLHSQSWRSTGAGSQLAAVLESDSVISSEAPKSQCESYVTLDFTYQFHFKEVFDWLCNNQLVANNLISQPLPAFTCGAVRPAWELLSVFLASLNLEGMGSLLLGQRMG